ncbi:hypothetical protein M378DRAFT_587996 [Amanita muscaria Koide BX008]|uniref:Uncharacterized protein n=1 Tax=Amanita muscaria (strain Koide BX008) TaxID=946122 RepID=A0A0C2WS12_AMAMK|nr:hypothetical protein M378DRAFT_587996 [Amanita muscaria Koide BX008]
MSSHETKTNSTTCKQDPILYLHYLAIFRTSGSDTHSPTSSDSSDSEAKWKSKAKVSILTDGGPRKKVVKMKVDSKERPTMDKVVQEMEEWISLGQFTLSS